MAYQPHIAATHDAKLVALMVAGLLLVITHAAHANDDKPTPPAPAAVAAAPSGGTVLDPYAGMFRRKSPEQIERERVELAGWRDRCVMRIDVDAATNVERYVYKPGVGGASCK